MWKLRVNGLGWGSLACIICLEHRLKLPNSSFMDFVNPSKDFLCFWMQPCPPSRDLMIKPPQSELGSKVYKDGVEGNFPINKASGTKWGEAGTSGTSFM